MDQSAQASTDIKKALQETVKLDDGRFGYIFTELPPIGLLSRWHCHVCGRTISSERSLLMHLTHPVHTSNLRAPQHPANHFKKFVSKSGSVRKEPERSAWSNTDVVPGEPVPPGMEDSIETCHIQEAFDNYKGPLIGLEYIVELVNLEDASEPRYICLLCEKRGDPRSVMVHVTSLNHFIKYICCFFRSAGNVLNLTRVTSENRKGFANAVRKVASEIEKHYGRLKPTSAAAETFAQKKFEILKAIDEKEHFRETPSTTFLHLVTPEKIKEYNDEEEEEALKPTRKPLAESKSQPSSKLTEKVTSSTTSDTKKLSFTIGKPMKSLGLSPPPPGTEPRPPGNGKKDIDVDDDVVVIEDDPADVKSLSSISSLSSPEMLRKRHRSRSYGKDSVDRRTRSLKDRSPTRRRHSRSRSRTPRRDYRRYEDRYRDDYRRERDRRDYTPERRRRDYSGDRRREYDDRSRRGDDDIRRRYEERGRSPYRGRDMSPDSGRSRRSPRRRSYDRNRSLDRKDYRMGDDKKSKWDDYRAELSKLEISFEKKLKYFESRPEKHPSYNEEWKNFWNNKYKEVQQNGQDPNTYDFKPEWIIYWGKRMKELNDEEFKLKSEELKNEMNVSMADVKGPSSDLVDISPASDDGKEVTVEDIRNTWKGLTGTDLSGLPTRSPPQIDSPKPNPVYHRPISSQSHHYRAPDSLEVAPPVIHCLRMLSVLENQLGSLAPRVLELLAKALILERSGTNKCMSLLEEPEIHVFFDTVKEKVRALLMAGVVERAMVSASRSVISIIDRMLHNHPPKSKPLVNKTYSVVSDKIFDPVPRPKRVVAPVSVPGIGMVDKLAVAQQIAGALVAQGRSDVSQEELEDLINAVVGIAKASNASFTSNTSSVSFFSQLNMENSTADSRINEILNTMIEDVTGQKVVGAPSDAPDNESEPLPQPLARDPTPPVKSIDNQEDELKNKLMKFNSLPREEQQSLIALLKELEKNDPQKVDVLRKYVSLGLNKSREGQTVVAPHTTAVDHHRTTVKIAEGISEKVPTARQSDDEDDDDYSYEDVYKAASEKLMKTSKVNQDSSKMEKGDSNKSGSGSTSVSASGVDGVLPKDFSNVFGPQRNPADKSQVVETAKSVNLSSKNSAPDVSNPNSSMSIDDSYRHPTPGPQSINQSVQPHMKFQCPPPSAVNSIQSNVPGTGFNYPSNNYGFSSSIREQHFDSSSLMRPDVQYNDPSLEVQYGNGNPWLQNNTMETNYGNDYGRGRNNYGGLTNHSRVDSYDVNNSAAVMYGVGNFGSDSYNNQRHFSDVAYGNSMYPPQQQPPLPGYPHRDSREADSRQQFFSNPDVSDPNSTMSIDDSYKRRNRPSWVRW